MARSNGFIAALLFLAAASLVAAIRCTYTSYFKTRVPNKRERMHVRALFFALLGCIGILCVICTYLVATKEPRVKCADA
jgi:hypothetical protein